MLPKMANVKRDACNRMVPTPHGRLTQLKQFTSLTGKFCEAQAQKRESNQRRQPAKRL
jgi:hypothetical protein